MNALIRLCATLLLLAGLSIAYAQLAEVKVVRVDVKHVGPAAVSDAVVRNNIRVRAGDEYLPASVDEDVRTLYATGQFYNIRVDREDTPEGVVLTYIVQGKPRLTDLRFQGNQKFSDAKLRKKTTSKTGEPLDERKLFTDCQEIQKFYQKKGYPNTQVKYVLNIDEAAGRGSATIEIAESRKVKIERVEFVGATAFSQKELRKIPKKTRKRWMFSWLTGSGYFKDEEFEDDRERLAEFYRTKGYIDFEVKNVQFEHPTPESMIIRFEVFEGKPYEVGSITFTGTTMLPTNAIQPDFKAASKPPPGADRRAWASEQQFHRAFKMKPGDTFTPAGLSNNAVAIENFYGARGHIDVSPTAGGLRTRRIPNVERNTMDLEYLVEEGQQSFIEKIEIRGNTRTKDKVIRRELAVTPGEPFDMVRVKLSEARLKGLQYFDKVELRPEPTEIPTRRDLLVAVEEKQTGRIQLGAGFSSVDALVGFVEFSQANFDLMKPPLFQGGGQKFRLRVQMGTKRQDFVITFIEPWFLGRKLELGVELYHREMYFQSLDDLYDETRTGVNLSLRRTLWSDFFIGGVSYTLERVGIDISKRLLPRYVEDSSGTPQFLRGPVPNDILHERGDTLLSKLGAFVAYDTRNSTQLPDAGQRTRLSGELSSGYVGSERDYYSLELHTVWYFRGLWKGHILEVAGRTGVTEGLDGDDVPFYDRYYLGGLNTLRGFKYRSVSPREPGFKEPIGGNTYWFGSAEYSVPLVQQEKKFGVRLGLFYDIGRINADAYDWEVNQFRDNWGVGLRLDLPIGPLRLDYAMPIHKYKDQGDRVRNFQFGVGYTREF
ncbi:MAG TPA: outer membrane protein assembly factor BamA [Verrucomicrobiota bacterium]|nr:MAG: Outer membrane protein assembly factor BamA precursor [Verrucomicrobia bacterium ADurb.Bin118]HPY31488.1 outer membrane protein assembly factor BamA [Verrucomicrobiota bacterium]HQB17777.1 outer membrane protein assembly factor BamA [Verrucomicrobiota bacterium]